MKSSDSPSSEQDPRSRSANGAAASDMLRQARERVSRLAQEQKGSAAEHIGHYGAAIRDSAKAMEADDPNVAYFANRAADRIERIADYVRDTDFEGLRHDAEEIARRHPVLFMGGMVLAGLALGQLTRATAAGARRSGAGRHGPDDGLGGEDDAEYPPGYYSDAAATGGASDYDAAATAAGASLGAAPGGLPPSSADTPYPGTRAAL